MKAKILFKKVQRVSIAVVLVILIPLILYYYKDLVFFWNAISVIAICYIIFLAITKRENKKVNYFWLIICLLLSIAIANGFYSYKRITSIFPILKKIPSGIMFALVLGLIILSVFIGFFYKYYICNTDVDLQSADLQPGLPEFKNNEYVGNNNIRVDKSDYLKPDLNSFSKNYLNKKEYKIQQAISFIATLLIIVIVISGIIYVFCKNEYILNTIYNQKLLYSVSQSVLLIGISIFAISIIITMILYFFRICYKIIYEMLTCHEKFYLKDELFLKCFSIFISISIFLFTQEATAMDLFNLSDNIVIKLLLHTLTLALLAVDSLVIYKLLLSILHEDGSLRKCAESIEKTIVEVIKGMLNGVLKLVENLPNILEELSKILKMIWQELRFILLENNEEEDIL